MLVVGLPLCRSLHQLAHRQHMRFQRGQKQACIGREGVRFKVRAVAPTTKQRSRVAFLLLYSYLRRYSDLVWLKDCGGGHWI